MPLVPFAPLVPVLCLVLMVYAVVRSQRKLRTALYGVLALAVILGALALVTSLLNLNGAVMGHAAFAAMFVVAAYVMWTHSRSTRPRPRPTPKI